MKRIIRILGQLAFIAILVIPQVRSQTVVKPRESFPDFKLQSHDNETIKLSDLKGKNVLLVFPRGKFREGWCRACHYQYAELAKLQIENNIEEKYNLKILFVLPYSLDIVKQWTTLFPAQMAIIESFKNLPEQYRSNPRYVAFSREMKAAMPISFTFDNDNPAPLPFPVLADEGHAISSNIGLFSTYWDNAYFEQNEPTVFILDREGIVQFKYKSQVTLDRPSADYLLNIIDRLL